MTIAAVKERLHEYIDHADNKKLKAIYTLLENEMEEDWETNNEALQTSIKKGLKELEKGLGRPHAEVMAELRKRYKA